jgi:glycolate oxidase FAD binding subunit
VDLIHPGNAADVADALRHASGSGTRMLIVGGRRHIDRGNPCEVDAEMWTTQLDLLESYMPAEMIAVVGAGMRVGELQAALAEGGQEWPVDAPDDATVGGVIAAAVSSPRRLRVGLVRDTVLELSLVTGDGRQLRSGAQTVKNVTGYDLHRLATGSLGTLGCIVRVALKLRPLPKARTSLVTTDGGLDVGGRLLERVPLPAAVVATPDAAHVRLEGFPDEVREQIAAARSVTGAFETSDEERFMPPVPAAPVVAEASVAPSRIPRIVEGRDRWAALLGVGMTWFGLEDAPALAALRRGVAEAGGVAPVVAGPGGLGDTPLPAPDVHRRLKDAFDPAGILAPGRFWGGL